MSLMEVLHRNHSQRSFLDAVVWMQYVRYEAMT